VVDGGLSEPIKDGAVVVEGDVIAWVGPAAAIPSTYDTRELTTVDLPNRTIMPGLVDGHVHVSFGEARSEEELAIYTSAEYRAIRAVWHARKILRAGVTSAFDAASTFNVAVAVRDAIEAGMFEGPRLAVCGRQITSRQGLEDAFPTWMEFPPGQAGELVQSRDEIVETIRRQVKEGVDVIKVSGSSDSAVTDDPLDGSAFRAEEFQLMADEAHRLSRQITVHARSRDSSLYCARAGFDWLMHASYIDDPGIEACLNHKVIICPTLTLLTNMIDSAQSTVGASGTDVFKREVEAAATNLSRAYRAGVPLVCGSESGWALVPFGEWHAKELQNFVELLGLTPLQAIHAATGAAARLVPKWSNRIGLLERGRLADLIVLEGDPTLDITLLQKPSRFDLILKGGQPVDNHTPIAERRIWSFEKHRIYSPGWFHFDESTGRGRNVM
jgi:imidazolonepropionase-like amidohydrolase